MSRHAKRRGWTLLELVAVVALLGAAVVALAPRLGEPSGEAQVDDALSALRDLDARARVIAARGGEAGIAVVGNELLLTSGLDEAVAARQLPSGLTMRIGGHGLLAADTISLRYRAGLAAGATEIHIATESGQRTFRLVTVTGRLEELR